MNTPIILYRITDANKKAGSSIIYLGRKSPLTGTRIQFWHQSHDETFYDEVLEEG